MVNRWIKEGARGEGKRYVTVFQAEVVTSASCPYVMVQGESNDKKMYFTINYHQDGA